MSEIWHEMLGGLPIILDSMRLELFEPENRRIRSMMNDLIKKNSALHNAPTVCCMMHNGVDYWIDNQVKSKFVAEKVFTHYQLIDEVNAVLKDAKNIALDAQLFRQMMFRVFSQANDMQEARDVIPDSIIQFAPRELKIPRKLNKWDFIFGSDKATLERCNRFMQRIEMYAGFHLLY